VLAGTLLPWSPLVPAALRAGWQQRKSHAETLFLLLWAGVIFAFFSESNSKLIPYILPVFPPLALLIGKWFAETRDGRLVRWQGIGTGLLLMLIGAAALAYPRFFGEKEIGVMDGAIVGGLLICQGIVSMVAARKGEPVRLFISLAATACIFAILAPPVIYARVAVDKSARELARAINEKAGKDARIACFGNYEQGIPFYTHKRVIVAGNPDELEFGSLQGDHSAWFMDQYAFVRLWDSPGTLFTVIKRRDLPMLQKLAATPAEVVSVAGERLLITNRPLHGAR
jgi:4-amino-4-deoxy-L-arabinose transferase-like glycosyltransferase